MEFGRASLKHSHIKISDQRSTYNNEGSQLNMVMQYLTENPDMLHNRVSDNTHKHSQQIFFQSWFRTPAFVNLIKIAATP